jgi:hypothetical protein
LSSFAPRGCGDGAADTLPGGGIAPDLEDGEPLPIVGALEDRPLAVTSPTSRAAGGLGKRGSMATSWSPSRRGFGGPGQCSALGRCAHLSTRRSRLAHGPTQSWLSMPPAALTRAWARPRGRSPRAAREWHVRRPRSVLGRGSKSANSSAIVSQVSQVGSRADGLGRTSTDLDGRSRVFQDRCAGPP